MKRFHNSGRSGFYLTVLQEGEISAGDTIDWLLEEQPSVSVANIVRLYSTENPEPELLRQASQLSALPDGWREQFRDRLEESG